MIDCCSRTAIRCLQRPNGTYRIIPSIARRELRAIQSELLRRSLELCGENCSFHFPFKIEGPERVKIGNRVSIASYVHIWGHGGVEIGDDCLIASHVAISSVTHDKSTQLYRARNVFGQVKIGSNVWIGTHAVVLPEVTVGDNAIIGAGAIVTRDVPAGAIVTGIPGRPRSA